MDKLSSEEFTFLESAIDCRIAEIEIATPDMKPSEQLNKLYDERTALKQAKKKLIRMEVVK